MLKSAAVKEVVMARLHTGAFSSLFSVFSGGGDSVPRIVLVDVCIAVRSDR